MITFILFITVAGEPDRAFLTKDCDADIRILGEYMPDADLYCIAPEYTMRPVARPEGVGL